MNTRFKWLFLILLFVAPAYAQNVRVDNVTFSSVQGFPFLPGATITICTAAATGLPCNPTVSGTCLSISDVTCNQSASLTSDAFGNYGFWIQPGSYTYTVTKAGFGGFGPRALTLACQPTATCTMTAAQTINSNLTVSGIGTITGAWNFSNTIVHSATLNQTGNITVGNENSVLWVDGVKYANCNAAIAAAGSTNNAIVIVPSTDSTSDTCTIPDTQFNISLWDYRGFGSSHCLDSVSNFSYNCGDGTTAAKTAVRVNLQERNPALGAGPGAAMSGETVLAEASGTIGGTVSVGGTVNGSTDVSSTYGTLVPNGPLAVIGHEAESLPNSTGASFTISTTSESSSTVTVTTTATCSFTTGQIVYISGNNVSGYNNSAASPTWTVLTPGCNGGSTFTYTNTATGLGAGTGGTVNTALSQANGFFGHINPGSSNTLAIALGTGIRATAPTNSGTGPIVDYYGGYFNAGPGGFSVFDNYGLYADSILLANDNVGFGIDSIDSNGNVRRHVFTTHAASPNDVVQIRSLTNTGGIALQNQGGGTLVSLVSNRFALSSTNLELCSTLFANISSSCFGTAVNNGDTEFCSDCAAGATAGSNAGAFVQRVNGAWTGAPIIVGATSQKTESAADANVLTVTPPAFAGSYRLRLTGSISAASAATLGWTATWTDSNGNAAAPTNLPVCLASTGTCAATTGALSAVDRFSGEFQIDVNNAGTAIVIKLTFSGTSFTAKVSATVERII